MARKLAAVLSAFAARRQQKRFAAERNRIRTESNELSDRMIDLSGYVHVSS